MKQHNSFLDLNQERKSTTILNLHISKEINIQKWVGPDLELMLELRVGRRMGRNKERVVGPSNGRKQNDSKEKEPHTEILRSHSMHCWGIVKKGLTNAGSKLVLERQNLLGEREAFLGVGAGGKDQNKWWKPSILWTRWDLQIHKTYQSSSEVKGTIY